MSIFSRECPSSSNCFLYAVAIHYCQVPCPPSQVPFSSFVLSPILFADFHLILPCFSFCCFHYLHILHWCYKQDNAIRFSCCFLLTHLWWLVHLCTMDNRHCDTVGVDNVDMDCTVLKDKFTAEENAEGASSVTASFSKSLTPGQKSIIYAIISVHIIAMISTQWWARVMSNC